VTRIDLDGGGFAYIGEGRTADLNRLSGPQRPATRGFGIDLSSMSSGERDQLMALLNERQASGFYNVVPRPVPAHLKAPRSRTTGRSLIDVGAALRMIFGMPPKVATR
jgi:hypothetical protein